MFTKNLGMIPGISALFVVIVMLPVEQCGPAPDPAPTPILAHQEYKNGPGTSGQLCVSVNSSIANAGPSRDPDHLSHHFSAPNFL